MTTSKSARLAAANEAKAAARKERELLDQARRGEQPPAAADVQASPSDAHGT